MGCRNVSGVSRGSLCMFICRLADGGRFILMRLSRPVCIRHVIQPHCLQIMYSVCVCVCHIAVGASYKLQLQMNLSHLWLTVAFYSQPFLQVAMFHPPAHVSNVKCIICLCNNE